MAEMFQIQCTPCRVSDRAWDTVKVDMSALGPEDEENVGNIYRTRFLEQNGSWLDEVEIVAQVQAAWLRDEKARLEAEQRRQKAQRQFEESQLTMLRWEIRRLEQESLEQERLDQERMEQQLLEHQQLEQERLEQAKRLAEKDAQRTAELARQEQERHATEERRKKEQAVEEEEHRAKAEADEAALATFLEEHKYTGVNAKRKNMFKFKYPLHTAVKLRDMNIVRVLMAARADATLRNSFGETPAELAVRLFKGDEHTCTLVQQALRG